ncbi:MAG: sulfite exporter TauE/SafE family protein [Dehalococcoidia bacterium]
MIYGLVIAVGAASGFLAGLVGLGGGILSAPLLLFAPGLFGLADLPVKEVTGLTMVQGLAGALSGLVRHSSYGFVSRRLVGYIGVSVAVTAVLGALLSQWVPDRGILAVFAGMAMVAALLVFLPRPDNGGDQDRPTEVAFNVWLAMGLAALIGLGGGLVGQAGSFILIPTMIYLLRIPTRIAIGSNLGIILLASLAGVAGKLAAAQVPLLLAAALVGGAIPGAQLGAWVGRRVQPRKLRYILAGVVGLAALRIWWDVFSG